VENATNDQKEKKWNIQQLV